jgi:hypothetical protein
MIARLGLRLSRFNSSLAIHRFELYRVFTPWYRTFFPPNVIAYSSKEFCRPKLVGEFGL